MFIVRDSSDRSWGDVQLAQCKQSRVYKQSWEQGVSEKNTSLEDSLFLKSFLEGLHLEQEEKMP